MAKIQHDAIPDNKRHEPKGASTAAADTFLTGVGDGSTRFRTLQAKDIPVKLTVEDTHTFSATLEQTIASKDLPTKVLFGAAEASTKGDFEILDTGYLKINTDGIYHIAYKVSPTKTPATAAASMAIALMKNDTQEGSLVAVVSEADELASQTREVFTKTVSLVRGDLYNLNFTWVAETGSATAAGFAPQTLGTAGDIPATELTVTKLGVV